MMPHQICPVWTWPLLYGFIGGNLLIAASYFLIPMLLLRARMQIRSAMLLTWFGLFIFGCGLTHVFKVLTVYRPWFWASVGMDVFTGIVSLITAILLWRNKERLLEFPPSIVMKDVLEIRERIALLSASMKA